MRFGHLRGVMLAVALVFSMVTVRSAFADGFGHTIPREVLARDLNTGEPYFAPPIPWGHYAKDGLFDHFYPKNCGICGLLLGKGPGCCLGHGLFGKGGKGGGHCGKDGCGHCGKGGGGLFHHGSNGCGDSSCGFFNGGGLGHGKRIKNCGLCSGKGCGVCQSSLVGDPFHSIASEQFGPASPQAPARVVVTPQSPAPIASSQACTEPGCKLGKGHGHGGSMGETCGGCGGKGCGFCGGLGKLFGKHHGNGGDTAGNGEVCGGCGGKGCGLCGGLGKMFGKHGNGCQNCGGKGCGLCRGLGSHMKGKLYGLLHPHAGEVKYFVGPGGPVPLTPGYVPYVVTTRSPRDFLSFPPYTPDGF